MRNFKKSFCNAMSIECLAVGDPYIQGENGPYHEIKKGNHETHVN